MKTHSLYLFGMFTYMLLHPHHIIPTAELVATLHKAANHTISQVAMELDAVIRQIRICASWSRYTGTHIEDAHLLELLLERIVKQSAEALPVLALFHIDGGLYCPIVSGTPFESTSVGISHQISVFIICHQIWVFLQCVIDTLPELINSRHFIFEGDSRIGDVWSIDFSKYAKESYHFTPCTSIFRV